MSRVKNTFLSFSEPVVSRPRSHTTMVPETTCFALLQLVNNQTSTENTEKPVEARTTPELRAHETSECEVPPASLSDNRRESMEESSSDLMSETESETSSLSTCLKSRQVSPTSIRLSEGGALPFETRPSLVPVDEAQDNRRVSVLTARSSILWDVAYSPYELKELLSQRPSPQKKFRNPHSATSECPAVPDSGESKLGATTLMIRNIDNSYNAVKLLTELTEAGLLRSGDFDFFYLPLDFRTNSSVGYGFINLTSVEICNRFAKTFNRYRLNRGTKRGLVNRARVQGLEANVEHYRNNPVMLIEDESAKPMMFDGNQRVRFPEPTAPIKPVIPKLKYRQGEGQKGHYHGQGIRNQQGLGRQAYRRVMESAAHF